MNKICKLFLVGLVGFLVSMGVVAQPAQEREIPLDEVAVDLPPMHHLGMHFNPQVEFRATKYYYAPHKQAFVVIDSIDCSIDLRIRGVDTVVGRFQTDSIYKRHDLKNILRPRSVAIINDYIVVLAVSSKDSSYIGVLGMEPVDGKLQLLSRADMRCISDAFAVSDDGSELIVVGTNPYGYNINIFDISQGIDQISIDQCESYGYRVKKQSEKIKESDPYGVGLTVVAVVVVFFALICIALILKGYGKAIINVQRKRAGKAAAARSAKTGVADTNISTPADTAGEVYAAIAAAIYLYDEELHDDEDGVITIQKVERAWTPWNAKYYNMNKYFNQR